MFERSRVIFNGRGEHAEDRPHRCEVATSLVLSATPAVGTAASTQFMTVAAKVPDEPSVRRMVRLAPRRVSREGCPRPATNHTPRRACGSGRSRRRWGGHASLHVRQHGSATVRALHITWWYASHWHGAAVLSSRYRTNVGGEGAAFAVMPGPYWRRSFCRSLRAAYGRSRGGHITDFLLSRASSPRRSRRSVDRHRREQRRSHRMLQRGPVFGNPHADGQSFRRQLYACLYDQGGARLHGERRGPHRHSVVRECRVGKARSQHYGAAKEGRSVRPQLAHRWANTVSRNSVSSE